MSESFSRQLAAAQRKYRTLLCLGLDPSSRYLPRGSDTTEDELVAWGVRLLEATKGLICSVKPNIAFYEAFGPRGMVALARTLESVPADVPVLLDCKRGDIGSTAEAYAAAYLGEKALGGAQRGAGAVTVSPLLGVDSVAPFLAYNGSMVFALCHTSNPSAREMQHLRVAGEGHRFYEHIATASTCWGTPDQVGLVVGATAPAALARVRQLCPDRWILAPGVGPQGGSLPATLRAGLRPANDGADKGWGWGEDSNSGLIVPLSRGIALAENPRAAAKDIVMEMRAFVSELHPFKQLCREAGELLRQRLVAGLQRIGCVRYGDFTLASGAHSPFYVDLRLCMTDPHVFHDAVTAYSSLLKAIRFDRIAGVPYGALPTASALAFDLGVPLLYPRKEGAKGHGMGRAIEGVWAEGDRVVVIEDIASTGGSALKSIRQLRDAGMVITDVVVLIDRQMGATTRLLEEGVALHAVMSLDKEGRFHFGASAMGQGDDNGEGKSLDTSVLGGVALRGAVGGFPLASVLLNASGALCTSWDELNALQPREGNPRPRWHVEPGMSINSMGIPNKGVEAYVSWLGKGGGKEEEEGGPSGTWKKPVVVSVCALSIAELRAVLARLATLADVKEEMAGKTSGGEGGVCPFALLEVNLSCPNVPGKPQVGYDVETMEEYLQAVEDCWGESLAERVPWGVKLPPYFDPSHFEQTAAVLNRHAAGVGRTGGLRFVTCINSLGNGLVIDADEDVVGCGGVTTGKDVFEHILAGAAAVQIGTQLVNEGPSCFRRIAWELASLMKSKGFTAWCSD